MSLVLLMWGSGSRSGNNAPKNGAAPNSDDFPIKRPIGSEEVKAILKVEDTELRNLLITLAYYDLSLQMDALFGFRHLNWCSFALWASNTAGKTIRKEFPPFPTWLVKLVCHIPFFSEAATKSSEAVIAGNTEVFSELGPYFAEMVERFTCDKIPDKNNLDEFVRKVRKQGEKEPNPLLGKNRDLIKALEVYHEAIYEQDSDRKGELVLFANLLVGLHEQTRLQTHIANAMELPLENSRSYKFLKSRISEKFANFICRIVQWNVRWFATENMLKYCTPTKTLCLGKNVCVNALSSLFPPSLAIIDHKELRKFIKRFDEDLHTVYGSDADDWANVKDRMRFIVDFFRTHQRHRQFLAPPFTPTQQMMLEQGKIPEGRLDGKYRFSVSWGTISEVSSSPAGS